MKIAKLESVLGGTQVFFHETLHAVIIFINSDAIEKRIEDFIKSTMLSSTPIKYKDIYYDIVNYTIDDSQSKKTRYTRYIVLNIKKKG